MRYTSRIILLVRLELHQNSGVLTSTEANKTASDMAVNSLLNVLETGNDQFKAN